MTTFHFNTQFQNSMGAQLVIIGPDRLEITPPERPDGWIKLFFDGSAEFGPDYNPQEAAKVFWEAVDQIREQRKGVT